MGLLEERRAQHKARERNRGWGLAISGRSPIVSPMYGDRQAGRRQGSITIEPPNGRHVTLQIPAQTWDGPLDFGTQALQDLGWSGSEPLTGLSTEAKAPATGYYDLHLDLETSEADDVTLTLEVDGETRWQKTLNVFLSLNGVLAVGEWRRGQTLKLSTDKPVSVSGGRVSMQLVEPQVGRVEDVPPDPPTSAQVNIVGSTGHSFSNTRTVSVPSGTQPGDLLLVVASVTSWETEPGLPNISDVTSAIAWTEVDRDVVNDGSPDRSKTSVWLRFAEDGDAGTSVSVDFTEGTAYAQNNTLSVWHLPQGALGSKTGQTSDVVSGEGAADATPEAVDEASVLDVVVFAAANYGSTTGRPSVSEPAGLVFQSTAVHGSSADKHRHGVAVVETQGSEQTWTVTSNDTTFGWFWRLRVRG